MKRMTWMVAALATALTFSVTSQAQAQTTGNRVGVVNVGVVFTKYQKAVQFKAEMEAVLKPYKDQAEAIKKNVLAHQEALAKPGLDEKTKDQYQQNLRVLKRQLEDLDLEARKKIGKRQEEHIVQLYKEVNQHVSAVASANGIHLVLGYGEPPDLTELFGLQNVDRKLTMMNMGGVVPLYFHSSLDISEVVVQSLNRSFGGTTATPTGNQK